LTINPLQNLFKKSGRIDWFSSIGYVFSLTSLIIFILTPIFFVFIGVFQGEMGWGLENFYNWWAIPSMRKGLFNALSAGFLTTIFTSIIGIPVAYIMTRYRFPGYNLLTVLLTLPLIMPPFIGAFSLVVMLGNNGIITNLLKDLFGMSLSKGFINPSLLSVVIVQTTHLWPLIYINTSSSLRKIDQSLEESARNLGASGFNLFYRITLPLAIPGYIAGAFLTFIWSLSDIGSPIMLSFTKYAPSQAFWELVRVEGIIEHASVICAILTLISISLLILVNRFVSLKEYATARVGSTMKLLEPSRWLRVTIYIFFIFIVGLSILPHIGTFIIAFTELPKYGSWILRGFNLEGWATIISRTETQHLIINSLLYASLAGIIDIILGAIIGYILVRKNYFGKAILDIISIMPLAVPGVVIALGYIFLFSSRLPGTTFRLSSYWLILVIAYSMRRIPYSVRSSHAALQQVHISLEEAAENLGANRFHTMLKVTLPLISTGLLAGGTMSFITAFTEVSTSLMIQPLNGPFGIHARPITLGIYSEIQRGAGGYAAAGALGVIQIVTATICFYLVNRFVGEDEGVSIGVA
jgi:iron(III) transport system permease protein